uniref:Helicase C-terminal domain-containing protein n=1 Tax=Strongyloides papillosus TaxID=174720 RepID=A0A0N5BK38_STREA
MERLSLKNFDNFPEGNHEIVLNHYDDFKMHKDIIDRIGQLGYTLTPSKLTYQINIALHGEEKRNVRLFGNDNENFFMYYFPLIFDRSHELHPEVPEKKIPLMVFVTLSPEAAAELYNTINTFVRSMKIHVVISHQGRKMEMNTREMRSPFHILVTTVSNLHHHVTKGMIRFDNCFYLVLVNIGLWKQSIDYVNLTDEMIKCGWDPVNKCSVIATSEKLDDTTKEVYSYFSFRKHYDFNIF